MVANYIPPIIDVFAQVEKDVEALCPTAIIRKIIGARRSIAQIKAWAHDTWKGVFVVIFLPKQFFIVDFGCKQDKDKVLQRALWKFEEEYVILQKWCPNFNLKDSMPIDKTFWIRLYNLPFDNWSGECLYQIDDSLGNALDLDMGKGDSIFFARILIIAIKSLPSRVRLRSTVGDWWQDVLVENYKKIS
ncbi:hypothetical protein SUGI_0992840 [Cryptomeria japonica]|nr:hypothetical protein SUGI_0992840 [Cryptomeria japonica]